MSRLEIKGWGCILTFCLFLVFALFCIVAGIYTFGYNNALRTAKNSLKSEVCEVVVECNCERERKDDWDLFIKALILVESGDKNCAIGSKDDVGVLQIRKVIVDDCNRILGYNKYTYEDRKDSLKSVEMFNVIQDYYNPEHDKHFALKLWNSHAPIAYHKKVFKKLKEND